MTAQPNAAFQRLAAEGRLLKPAFQGPTHSAGRYGFRGEIGLSDDASLSLTAVFAAAAEQSAGLDFLAGQLAAFSELPALVEALGEALIPGGKYFIYVGDVKRGDRMEVSFGPTKLRVLPFDDVSVYNELIEFLYLDKAKMKKYDTPAKIDAIADGAAGYDEAFAQCGYEEGLSRI